MITIIDYGMGNLGSIANMIKRIGSNCQISSDIGKIAEAEKIIIPGVGNFDKAMENILSLGLLDVLKKKALTNKIPILGICLGMQIMCKSSEEGNLNGLGWINADVIRFKLPIDSILKIPHMGWNNVDVVKPNQLIKTEDGVQRFYFVHAYHAVCNNQQDVLATTHHGYEITAAFSRDNIYGVQFHPEKSHRFGMALMKKFIEL